MIITKIKSTETTNCAIEKSDLGQTVYETLCRYVARNRYFYPDKLISPSGDYILEQRDKGFIVRKNWIAKDGKNYNALICFHPKKLDEILRNAGFANTKEALEAVRKKGLLKCHDRKRLYCHVKINGMKMKMYGIWVQID